MGLLVYELNAILSFFASFFLCFVYVSSLYIHVDNHDRNSVQTIRRRFIAVSLVSILAIPYVWFWGTESSKGHSLWQWLGLSVSMYTLSALVLPLLLTMLFFAGPLLMRKYHGVFSLYTQLEYWRSNVHNIFWLRTHVMGPLTEEFVFRSCLIPLLVPAFGLKGTVIFSPMFFGIAHLHHMIQKVHVEKEKFTAAMLSSLFQFAYTTIFGIYASFLFVRTGHFISCFLVHAFCNHMGVPDFNEIFHERNPDRKSKIIACLIGGPALFFFLVLPLTHPSLYGNNVYQLLNSW